MNKNYGIGVTAALTALTAGSILLAPVASAADVSSFPVPGSQSADVVYNQLKGMGYSVAINWTNGSAGSLSRCKVTGYHAPGPANPNVYMDVVCPSEASHQ